jgi:hypothetical protein
MAVLTAAAVAIAGCGPTPPRFSFKYDAQAAGGGSVGQILQIVNHGNQGIAPTLQITPLDAGGSPVSGVRVRTALGSDRGGVVVPPLSTSLDVLRFDGPHARDVDGVRVKISHETRAPDLSWSKPVASRRLDADGHTVPVGEPFASVGLDNPNDGAATVRIVLLTVDHHSTGGLHQFVRATPLESGIHLAPSGRRHIALPRALRDRFVGSVVVIPSR